jgi:hypothetical protein
MWHHCDDISFDFPDSSSVDAAADVRPDGDAALDVSDTSSDAVIDVAEEPTE